MRLALLAALLAGCFAPREVRRESSQVAADAGPQLRAALAPAPAGPSVATRFQQHYQAALAFYDGKQFPEAIAEFEAAYAVDNQPLLLFNIGQAYRKAGKLDLA